MRFITCASYYGTGSSAVTDLVNEYEAVYNFSDFEFRFIHDPDGISDLEYNLVENHNRHNSGHALKRYKRLVDFNCGVSLAKKYEAFFKGNWKKYSYEYIDSLTDFKYQGHWMYDLYDRGNLYYYSHVLPEKLLKMSVWRNQPDKHIDILKGEWTLCSDPGEEKFLKLTREYIEKLFSSVVNGADTIMVDQLLPPTNLNRYLRYFSDIKVIIVDRDPRDIWALEKYYWKTGVIPHDVSTFCKWFRYTRNHRKKEVFDSEHVLFIQFEDMIYKYDETVKKIEDFLNLSPENHVRKKTSFNPSKSIHNTKTWMNPIVSKADISKIETELSEYLYQGF